MDNGDDEASLTCMISNSQLSDDYETGHFHIFLTEMYVILKHKTALIFSELGKHGGTPSIAPDGVMSSQDAASLMMVFYCPKSILFSRWLLNTFCFFTKWNTFHSWSRNNCPFVQYFSESYVYIF